MKFLKLDEIIKKKLFLNSVILSLPSIIGIILALVAIPIHLKINGKYDYGNYIFFHFIISFGLLLNLGINKIATIEISKKKYVDQIINQSLIISLKIILIIFLLYIVTTLFLKNNEFLLLTIIGISITILYLNFDGILQGLGRFKLLSIVNFIFYTLAINIPSISLIFFENLDFYSLIKISIIIKFLTLTIILINLKKNFYKNTPKKLYKFSDKLKKYSKWYVLHFLNIQIYDFLDKYLIKIFIGPVALAIYSIPYQVSGKITIFSKSIAAVLLPEISLGKEKDNFKYSIKILSFIFPLLLLSIFPYLNSILVLWLQEQYSNEILNLTKIFFITSWISGISHLLIAYFEGKKKIKFNSLLEVYFITPFLFVIIFVLLKFSNLIYVALVLLAKEVILLFLRMQKIDELLNFTFQIYISIFVILINLVISLYFDKYFIYSFLTIVFINLFLTFKSSVK